MSDLVGNPEERFNVSRDAADISFSFVLYRESQANSVDPNQKEEEQSDQGLYCLSNSSFGGISVE